MDNLTHGLLGVSLAALRRGDGQDHPGPTRTQKATLLGCVLAAELPDLDLFLPADNPALHALRAHRGLSHALVFAPVWAAVGTGVAKALYREVRAVPLFGFCLAAVLLAHLAADAWTGWGTRLLLPFSDWRVTWDWMLVLDPWFTAPLLVGGLVALFRRQRWRGALLAGLLVAVAYLGARVGIRAVLLSEVRERHPAAERIAVFPGWMGIARWRFVAVEEGHYVVGELGPLREVAEQARVPRPGPNALPPELAAIPSVQEALAWARFPMVVHEQREDGSAVVRVADLRYHVRGEPTLEFAIELSASGQVLRAELERGGTASELLTRWRAADPAQ